MNEGMKSLTWLASFLLFCKAAFAGVTLVNDSTYKLTVHIRASDGTDLGSLSINSQQTMSWSNYMGGSIQYYDASQTPYTVIWFCNNGSTDSPYSIWTNVAAGSVVTANGGDGVRSCQAPKKKPREPAQQQPPPSYPAAEQSIQQQTEEEAGPPQGFLQ